jgi:Xaa-Pro aminopeptidase
MILKRSDMSGVPFPSPGFDKDRFTQRMASEGLSGFLITSPENVYYSTGYPAIPSAGNPILFALKNVLPFFVYIDQHATATLFCWGGAATGVQFEAENVITFPDAAAAVASLKEYLEFHAANIQKLGIESTCPYFISKIVEEIFGSSNLQIADNVLQYVRLIKSPKEIGYLKTSTEIVEKAVSEVMELVKEGVRRPFLIHEAKTRMLAHGATGIGHVTLSFGSSNPEVEIDERLEHGKLVVLDLGAQYLGYASDNRRLMFTGKIPDGMIELHKRMCGIVDEIASKFVPGKTFNEMYDLALSLYSKNNLDPFIPNVGHTIGLNTEEEWIYKNSNVIITPGMVLNLELYSLYETGELIGDEETYVVGETGMNQITNLPREIRSV